MTRHVKHGLISLASMLATAPLHAAELRYCPQEIRDDKYFNAHILCAVDELGNHRNGGGWKNVWFTRNLDYGPNKDAIKKTPNARTDHGTMCDAAVSETLVESLNIYYKSQPTADFYVDFPKEAWGFKKETGILAYIGEQAVRDCSGEEKFVVSTGAADALEKFGMGKIDKFERLTPGDVIRFDRVVGPGHSTIFLGYITHDLTVLTRFDPAKQIVGFQYFSSQSSTEGFGVRSAYFESERCGGPVAPATVSDCLADGQRGIIKKGASLVAGHMLHPDNWTLEKAKADRLAWLSKNKVINCTSPELTVAQMQLFARAAKSIGQTGPSAFLPFAHGLTAPQKSLAIKEFTARSYHQKLAIPGLEDSGRPISDEALANLVAHSLALELSEDFVGHRTQALE